MAIKDRKNKIFICYSRRDMVVVDLIVDVLIASEQGDGFDILIDRRSLPAGQRWNIELQAMIDQADTVVFFISAESAASIECRKELDYAERNLKRIIPAPLAAVTPTSLPQSVQEWHLLEPLPNWNPHTAQFQIWRNALITTLLSDAEWLREHTRLGDRARQWKARGGDRSLLLRDTALVHAQKWIEEQPPLAPPPGQDVMDLVLASHQAAALRQRRWLGGIAVGAAVLASLATFGVLQWRAAIANEEEQLRADSRFRAEQSSRAVAAGDATTGINLALLGIRDERSSDKVQRRRPLVEEAGAALTSAWLAFGERTIITHGSSAPTFAVSPDGSRLLTLNGSTLKIWSSDGRLLQSIEQQSQAFSNPEFAPDGRHFAVSRGGAFEIRTSDGKLVRNLVPRTPSENFPEPLYTVGASAKWSPDGNFLVTFGGSFASARGGLVTRGSSSDLAYDLVARVWASDGREIALLRSHPDWVRTAKFSPDGKQIVTTSGKLAFVWSASGALSNRLESHEDSLSDALFSPKGDRILTLSSDNTARLWSTDAKVLATLRHTGPLRSAQFSDDGSTILTTVRDNSTPQLWSAEGALQTMLAGHAGVVRRAIMLPNVQAVLTVSDDRTIRYWDFKGKVMREVTANHQSIADVAHLPSGQLVTSHNDGTVRLWGNKVRDLKLALLSDSQWIGAENLTHLFLSPPTKSGARVVPMPRLDPASATSFDMSSFLRAFHAGDQLVMGVTPTPAGHRVVVGRSDDSSNRLVIVIYPNGGGQAKRIAPAKGYWQQVEVSSSGARIAGASSAGGLHVFNETGEEIASDPSLADVRQLMFSADGNRLAVLFSSKAPLLWELSGKPQAPRPLAEKPAKGVSFSPVGSNVALVIDDAIRIVSGSGQQVSTIKPAPSRKTTGVFYAPKGDYLVAVAGSRAYLVKEDGSRLADLVGHCPPGFDYGGFFGGCTIAIVGFSSDGSRIVTSTSLFEGDGTARVWNREGKELLKIGSRTSGLDFVSFGGISADGKSLLTLGARNRVWPVVDVDQQLIDDIKSKLARCIPPGLLASLDLVSPPRWCITGPGLEQEKDASKWRPKLPYDTQSWKDWQLAADAAEAAGKDPPDLPEK